MTSPLWFLLLEEDEEVDSMILGLEVYERGTSTLLGTGLIVNVLAATITRAVDRIGAFSIDIPASDRQFALLTQGREVALIQEGVGTVWRGIVDTRSWRIDSDGTGYLTIGGGSLALELQWESTYMGIIIDDFAAGDAIDAIIDGTGWTKVLTGAGYQNLSNRYDNMTLWQALTDLAGIEGAYVRETNTAREIEMSRSTTDSGIILSNVESAGPLLAENPWLGLIEGLPSVREEGTNIVNRLVALGLDAGNIIYDLGHSDRTSPYTIQSFHKNRPSVTRVEVLDDTPIAAGLGAIKVVGITSAIILIVNRSTNTVSGVTAGGRPMYLVAELNVPGASDVTQSVFWATGLSGDVALSLELDGNSTNENIRAVIIALQDVDQTDPIRNSASSSGTSATPSTIVASGADDLVIDALTVQGTSVATPDASQTLRGESVGSNNASASSEAGTGSNVTMSWTVDVSAPWVHTAMSIRPAITYYIEDAASVSAYGRRVSFLADKGKRFVSGEEADLLNAANTLYDQAVTALERNKDPVTFYEVDVAHLPDIAWLVGDSMRLLYRGAATDQDGEYVWLDVDADVKVMEATETWDSAGVRHWHLMLSTVYRFPRTNDEVLGENLAKILSLESM